MKSIKKFINFVKKIYIKIVPISNEKKQFLTDAYYDKGEFKLACGKHEEAIACFDMIIELNPNNVVHTLI